MDAAPPRQGKVIGQRRCRHAWLDVFDADIPKDSRGVDLCTGVLVGLRALKDDLSAEYG